MTGEMHPSEVTAENFPLHFAVVKEFGGSVHPFDQYQGPYVNYRGNRYFLDTDDGVFACWWRELDDRYSPSFTATDDDIVFAVAAFRDLIENGGTDEPDWNKSGLIIDADGTLALLHSLQPYISGDDAALPREQFLRMVADRITEDLPPRQDGYVTNAQTQYTFTGKVYYQSGTPELHSAETTITVAAPTSKIAKEILRHYGMDSMRLVK